MLRLGWAAVALMVVMRASVSEACSPAPRSNLNGVPVLPAASQVAPRNTLVWITDTTARGDVNRDSGASPYELRRRDAGEVVFDQTDLFVHGFGVDDSMHVLAPRGPLEAEADYEVWLDGGLVTNFHTSSEVDTLKPEAPTATVGVLAGKTVGPFCGGHESMIQVTAQPTADFLLLVAGDGLPMFPTEVEAISIDGGFAVEGLSSGPYTLVAVDLSGNMTPSRALTVTLPPTGCGCSSHSGASVAGLALAHLALRMRRRRE